MALVPRLVRPSLLQPNSTPFICLACRRNESSYRRTRKALKIKPDPSFLPSKTATSDHIIFNPPSSAPNVYHTPLKFLPKDDPRRKLYATSVPTTAKLQDGTSPPPRLPRLPPPVRPEYEKKYHLRAPEIEEIRRLRKEDPKQWTRARLAQKFECSQFFIGLCCSSPEAAKEQDKALAEIKRKWGRRKTEAREDRQTRKEMWGRDA